MVRVIAVASIAVLLSAGEPVYARTILYVNQNATGPTHDGWTWCTAFTELQDAMEIAVWDVTIRVADGTYTPDRGTGGRDATFQLTTNVAVEGGYAGCGAADPDERDVELYETILSGNLGEGPGGGTAGETCADAGPITNGETFFDTTGATTDGPDGCLANQDIWYVYTAQHTTDLRIRLCGSSYHAYLALYEGATCPATIRRVCIDNDDCDNPSDVSFHVTAGTDYLIRVGGLLDETGTGIVSIDYGNSEHVVTASGTAATAVLDGFTITGGNAIAGGGDGGGMLIDNGSPTIVACVFRDNYAEDNGGGLYSGSGTPTVTDCMFDNNLANDGGGAFGSLTLANCTFKENSATNGGGVYFPGGGSLTDCVFTDNSASNAGGGVNVSSGTLTRCIFVENTANHGGGMYGGGTIHDCKFSGNSATSSGGAVYQNGSATFHNCTFNANSAPTGQGIKSGGATMKSCVLWDGVYEVDGSASITYSNVYGGWPGSGNIFAIPYFVDADGADDVPGTVDDDLRLLSESPCIDVGDPSLGPDPDDTDLDGNPRVVYGRVDMGAYEFQRPCDTAEDCDDGLYCNGVETCEAGGCAPGDGDPCAKHGAICDEDADVCGCDDAAQCDDEDACTDDTCEPEIGCTHSAVECDAGYVCVEGSCDVVCELMDTDGDGDIDLRDHAVWQNCFSGPGE